jgi:CHAD domain-containing protein
MSPKTARLWPDSATILERSRGVFFAQWEELLRLRRAVIKSADLDDIHDLRVASRRFRAVLELFYPFLPKGPKTELRKNIRKLTRILGGLRNIDEALLFFRDWAKADVSAENTLVKALSKLRPGEFKRIEKALKAFDSRTLDRMVRDMVAGVNEDSITERNSISLIAYFSDVSIRQYLPIHQLLNVSTVPEHHASRHALRIAIKKWRYFFENISLILDRDYTSLLELLKEYQSLLGRMNDVVEFEVLLGNLKLPPEEREYAKATLAAEDTCLLESFTELIERKPLVYTFLI